MTEEQDMYRCQINTITENYNVVEALKKQIGCNEIKEHVNVTDINYKNKTFTINIDEHPIIIDWTCSTNVNIQQLYTKIKNIQNKIDKSNEAINSIQKQDNKKQKLRDIIKSVSNKIEETINDDVNAGNIEDTYSVMDHTDTKINRKQLWFENFNWFLSSDNFIVVSGKTAQQNEQIVKKYMDKYDIYVHSDTPGSGSCVIKNTDKLQVPLRTLEEAGQFVICHTKSWVTNVPDKSWYVSADQVSKTTESGEYVTTGSFIIRGKKNYISANKMELGFGILFWDGNVLQREWKHCSDCKFAVVTCAPYKSTLKYQYKRKAIPGTGKVGKGVKNVLETFTKDKKMPLIEKSLIKNIPIDDWHRVSPGKMRVV
jgi:predicted ribosome quality control (RQC) complex YloA/Tae2 family protein